MVGEKIRFREYNHRDIGFLFPYIKYDSKSNRKRALTHTFYANQANEQTMKQIRIT